MKSLYFTHLRGNGYIRIPAGVIDGLNLTTGSGFTIEPDPLTNQLHIELISSHREPDTGCSRPGRGTNP